VDGLTLLAEAQAAGLRVAAQGARIVIRGPREAEPVAALLMQHKNDVAVALRVTAFRSQLDQWRHAGHAGIPLLALPGIQADDRTCVSCGAAPEPDQSWRCALCAAALRFVLYESPAKATCARCRTEEVLANITVVEGGTRLCLSCVLRLHGPRRDDRR
jgi:hypothetical protein